MEGRPVSGLYLEQGVLSQALNALATITDFSELIQLLNKAQDPKLKKKSCCFRKQSRNKLTTIKENKITLNI